MPARPRECTARVTAVRALAPDVLEAELAMVEPPALSFAAGQWVSVPFGPKSVRAYSIASTPRSPRRLTLCADVAPGGIGSLWFRALSPGDEVRFKGPLGGFVFSRADPRRPLFVAEEIGIVPIRAILSELYATGFGRPTTLVYAARAAGWHVYDRELRSLARRYPGFAYHPEGLDAAAAVERLVADVAGLVAYVAGGEATIDRVRQVLLARGLERRAVRWERFW
jgi:ferredoxin-NADP reductase